jgi:riboflavin synthase
MFTGLIEATGRIEQVTPAASGRTMRIAAPFAAELRPGDSVAVNGVCLTVATADDRGFQVSVSPESLRVTTFRTAEAGHVVNLERPLPADGRLGGHFVLGHVDAVGRVIELLPQGDCHWLSIEVPTAVAPYLVPKGSIAVDGISLTIASLEGTRIGVQIVPFTYDHTCMNMRRPGDAVNIETDVLGKYVVHLIAQRGVLAGEP